MSGQVPRIPGRLYSTGSRCFGIGLESVGAADADSGVMTPPSSVSPKRLVEVVHCTTCDSSLIHTRHTAGHHTHTHTQLLELPR